MGARARARRLQLGVKPHELSHILGFSSGRLMTIEREGVDSIRLARQWANALGLTLTDLLEGNPELDELAGIATQKET